MESAEEVEEPNACGSLHWAPMELRSAHAEQFALADNERSWFEADMDEPILDAVEDPVVPGYPGPDHPNRTGRTFVERGGDQVLDDQQSQVQARSGAVVVVVPRHVVAHLHAVRRPPSACRSPGERRAPTLGHHLTTLHRLGRLPSR